MNDHEIEKQIQSLRDGGELTADAVKALALGISKRFRELAEHWGRRYEIGGWVKLKSFGERLHFCKRQGKWQFIIVYPSDGDESDVADFSLRQRQIAAEALPELQDVLEANRKADRGRLLDAFDTISKYADEAIDD